MSDNPDALLPGEVVIERARLHWAAYREGVLLLSASLLPLALGGWMLGTIGVGLLVMGGLSLLLTAARLAADEVIVTNRRFILKTGYFDRVRLDLPAQQILTVTVDQPWLAGLADFGRLTIQTAHEGRIALSPLAHPGRIQQALFALIDHQTLPARSPADHLALGRRDT